MNEEEPSKGFRVTDRRRFTPEGESKNPDAPPERPTPQVGASEDESAEHRGKGFTARPGESSRDVPEMNFATFVLSLHASALVHLGLIEDPHTGERPPVHLPLARQTIDILQMLADKTQGNLSAEEEKLLRGVLYELRMHFVHQSGGKVPGRDTR